MVAGDDKLHEERAAAVDAIGGRRPLQPARIRREVTKKKKNLGMRSLRLWVQLVQDTRMYECIW